MRTLFLLLSFLALAAAGPKNYAELDHTDESVRSDIKQDISRYWSRNLNEMALKIIATVIPEWSEYEDDLKFACRSLYDILYLDSPPTEADFARAEGCPDDIRDKYEGRVDREPVSIAYYSPTYKAARRLDAGNYPVVVMVRITEIGEVKNVKLVCAASKKLRKETIQKVQEAIFLPAIRDGAAVRTDDFYISYTVRVNERGRYSTLINTHGANPKDEDDNPMDMSAYCTVTKD